MAMGGRAGEVFTEINVTPLTDVFLVLLVIMILVAPLINSTVLKVDPPQAGANTPPPNQEKYKIDVEVLANGVIKINNVPASSGDSLVIQQMLQGEMQKAQAAGMQPEDVPLNLASEPDSIEKNVVAVMDAAAGAGIKKLRVLPLRNLGDVPAAAPHK
jgi:biopolymer transport protein ExbD/biopolymer transport protein TolR